MKNKYDVIDYWNKREVPNSKTIGDNTPTHLIFINKNLENVDYLLDFGPGDGRLLEAYVGVSKIEGYDISDMYKDRLLANSSRLGLHFHLTIEKKIGNLPYKNKEFDAAVATEVLLHQKPEHIELIMSELIRVAKKVIVITLMEDGVPYGLGWRHWCFHHDYFTICKRNNWEVFNIEKYKKQVMFVYKLGDKGGK